MSRATYTQVPDIEDLSLPNATGPEWASIRLGRFDGQWISALSSYSTNGCYRGEPLGVWSDRPPALFATREAALNDAMNRLSARIATAPDQYKPHLAWLAKLRPAQPSLFGDIAS